MQSAESPKLVVLVKNNHGGPASPSLPNFQNVSISKTSRRAAAAELSKVTEELVDEPEEACSEETMEADVAVEDTIEAEASAEKTEEAPARPLGEEDPLTCYICRQTRDEEGRLLNQRNIFFVRSHLAKCLYRTGKLFQSVPPGRNNTDGKGGPIDETGALAGRWYHCQVEDCWLAQQAGKAGQVCYKVYALHMASQHGALEMVLLDEGPEARALADLLIEAEGKRRQVGEPGPGREGVKAKEAAKEDGGQGNVGQEAGEEEAEEEEAGEEEAVEEKAVEEEAGEEEAGQEEAGQEEAVQEEAVVEEAVQEEAGEGEAVEEEDGEEEAEKEEAVEKVDVQEEDVEEEAVEEEAVEEEAEKESLLTDLDSLLSDLETPADE